MKDKEKRLSMILRMFSELRTIFDSVNYEGDFARAKKDVSFKGFSDDSEQQFNTLASKILLDFEDGELYIIQQKNNKEMMPKYLLMLEVHEKRDAQLFNQNESTEAERKKHIELVVDSINQI